MTDPRKLRPTDLCRLLNSTPLGEVIKEQRLKVHRTRAGLRIGDARHVDLVRYVAWLVHDRHAPKSKTASNAVAVNLAQAAEGAAVLGSIHAEAKGHGQRLTSRQEAVIAALLTEPTYAEAAAKAGVSEATLYRWLHLPSFRAAYRRARRELIEAAIGRIQAATGQAVETLLAVARQGKRDGDRVRAAVALLEHACRGLEVADLVHADDQDTAKATPMNTTEVVAVLASRLRQLDQSQLSTAEKSRLTATLADAVLRAIGVDVLAKRMEALETVLLERKEKK